MLSLRIRSFCRDRENLSTVRIAVATVLPFFISVD
jgi:hypothetical protein